MLDLFVWDTVSGGKVPAVINAATEQSLVATKGLADKLGNPICAWPTKQGSTPADR